MRRVARTLVAVSVGILASSGATAWATTTVTYVGDPSERSKINVMAAANEKNEVGYDYRFGTFVVIRDTEAGITESSPHCEQVTSTRVRCDATGLERVAVSTLNRSDIVRVREESDAIPDGVVGSIFVDLGTGNDKLSLTAGTYGRGTFVARRGADRVRVIGVAGKLRGGLGDDILMAGALRQRIAGGDGNDVLGGGPGIDHLSGGDGVDTCDGGGNTDTFSGCENRRR